MRVRQFCGYVKSEIIVVWNNIIAQLNHGILAESSMTGIRRREISDLFGILPLCLNVCFKRIGSRTASSSSPTFSSNTGLPNLIAFSNVLKLYKYTLYPRSTEPNNRYLTKSGLDSLITSNPRSFSRLLIHLLACPCGSIMRGHLRELNTIVAFSIDKASAGSP
jgi:hypothetical protein